MNIFFLSRGYPSARDPMWGCFERDQAEALAGLGHRVTLLSVDVRLRFYWRPLGVTKRTVAGGITTYNSFWCPRKLSCLLGNSFEMYLAESQVINLYERAVREQGTPDVIYAHYLPNMELGVRLKRRFGVPVVGIEHWSELGKSKIHPSILRRAGETYSQLSRLITVSSALAANVKRQLGIDSVVINNMHGPEFSYQPRTATRKTGDLVRLVAVGSLLPVKDYATMLSALRQLKDCGQLWQMQIVGGGKNVGDYQALIDSSGLSSCVKLMGLKSKTEIAKILHASDVYVLSSRSETFGVAALEALAVGLPVVTTDCGGPRDFHTEQNGRMVPVGDANALALAILYVMTHLSEFDSEQIARDCEARFSRDAIARQVEEVLKKVTAKS